MWSCPDSECVFTLMSSSQSLGKLFTLINFLPLSIIPLHEHTFTTARYKIR